MEEDEFDECLEKGLKSIDLGKHQEAIKYFDRAIGLDPLNGHVYVLRGRVKMTLGLHEDGGKDFKEANQKLDLALQNIEKKAKEKKAVLEIKEK